MNNGRLCWQSSWRSPQQSSSILDKYSTWKLLKPTARLSLCLPWGQVRCSWISHQAILVVLDARSLQFGLRLRRGWVQRGTHCEVPHVTDDSCLRCFNLIEQSLVFLVDRADSTSGSFTTHCSLWGVVLHLYIFACGWVLTSWGCRSLGTR